MVRSRAAEIAGALVGVLTSTVLGTSTAVAQSAPSAPPRTLVVATPSDNRAATLAAIAVARDVERQLPNDLDARLVVRGELRPRRRFERFEVVPGVRDDRSVAMAAELQGVACAELRDASGSILWAGTWDRGWPYLVADFAAARLSEQAVTVLRSLVPRGVRVERSVRDLDGLPTAADAWWLPWVVRLDALPAAAPTHSVERVVEPALRALATRPVWAARVLRRAFDRRAELASTRAAFAWCSAGAATTVARHDPDVAAVRFEILLAHRRLESARSAALAYLEACRVRPAHVASFVRRLGRDDARDALTDVRLHGLELALELRPDDLALLREQFDALRHACADLDAARSVGERIVELRADDCQFLNSFAWRLSTDPDCAERFPQLALRAASAMTRVDGWRTYWRLDTLALAQFQAGFVDEAIEIQEEAVASCAGGGARVRYEQRLARYRAERAAIALRERPSSPGR